MIGVKVRQAGPLRGHVHPVHVQGGSEEPHLPVHTSVGFHAFIQFLSVVKYLTWSILSNSLMMCYAPPY